MSEVIIMLPPLKLMGPKAGSAKVLERYGFAINSEIKADKENQLS